LGGEEDPGGGGITEAERGWSFEIECRGSSVVLAKISKLLLVEGSDEASGWGFFPFEGFLCDLLRLVTLVNPSWFCMSEGLGDWGLAFRGKSLKRGRTRMEQENEHFKEFIQNNTLIDSQFCNGTHTWSNRRIGRHQIASKLDRFLLTDNIVHLGGDITAAILPYAGSDHWPIALQWQRPGNANK